MTGKLAIIGAGRVGRVLGRALRQRGWRIGAVMTQSHASAKAAVRSIGGGEPGWRVSDWPFHSDVILLAVPDRDMEGMANVLSLMIFPGMLPPSEMTPARKTSSKRMLRGKIVLHTSGSLSHVVLAPLRRHGAAIGAMHPMQTFGRGTATRLDGVVFGIDGDARAVRVAQQMVRALGGIPVRVKPERKVTYHLSGGFAAQHLLTVLEAGVRILMDAGLTRKQATQALLWMAQQTMANLQRLGPQKAWTGPVPRGDYSTVAKHMRALCRFPPEYKRAYVALTRLAVHMLAHHPRKMLHDLNRVFGKD